MGILGLEQPGQARYSGEEHNLQITQAVFGTTLTILFGTRRLAPKLLFYGGFQAQTAPSSNGKGIFGGKGTEWSYFADVEFALAAGSETDQCRGILNVWNQQGKLQNQSGTFNYTIPSGGGSVSPVSGSSAPIQMDLGVAKSVAYSVTANDYGSGGLRTLTGTQMVSFQKVTGTLGAGQYSFNPATSMYTFSAADAGTQVAITYSSVWSLYYLESTEPAQVPLSAPYQVSPANQQYFSQDLGVQRIDGSSVVNLVSGTDYTVSSGVYSFSAALAGALVYINYQYTSSDSTITNTSTLNLTFFSGALGQAPWSYMQSKYPGSAFGYPGICYAGANPMAMGMTAVMSQYNYEVVGLSIFPGGGLDAHFCDAFKVLLSDAFLGVGFPVANIGDWTSCYAYWAANGYLGSFSLDMQTSVAEAMGKVLETGNAGPVWSEGLLKLIPYGDQTAVGNGYTYTPNTTPVRTLTWNDLLPPTEHEIGSSTNQEPLQVSRKAPQDCWNYVQAQWCNRLNDYNNELINAQNDAWIAKYGRRIEAPQTWDWITTEAAAAWALDIRLKRQLYLPTSFKFWLSFRHADLEPMDAVVLPTGEAVRITSIVDDPNGRRAIEAEPLKYGASSATIYPRQQPSSFQPGFSTAQPGDAVPIVVQNTLVQSSVPYLVQIAAAGKSANWGGANIYLSLDGATYTKIGTVKAPSAIGLLTAALPATADPDLTDTLSVDLGLTANPELVSVSQLLADKFTTLCAIIDQGGVTSELLSYQTAALTAAGRYNLTYLRRGAYGTSPLAHTVGASFAFLGPQYQFATYQYGPGLMGHTFYLKLQSFNLAGNMLQDLSQIQAYSFVFGETWGAKGDIYFPSGTYSAGLPGGSAAPPTLTGSGSATNPNAAFDGLFDSQAVFDAGALSASASSAGTTYSGFPSLVLSYPATLYITYKNLRGVSDITGSSVSTGGNAGVLVSVGGAPIGSNWNVINAVTYNHGTLSVPGSAPQGTVAVSLPAGTNLGILNVGVWASNWATPGSNPDGYGVELVAGHIEIVQIWVQ